MDINVFLILSVARRAAGQNGFAPDVVSFCKLRSNFSLVGRRLPRHIKNLILGSKNAFGVSMALQAPLHL
jgi:hypothetical protein